MARQNARNVRTNVRRSEIQERRPSAYPATIIRFIVIYTVFLSIFLVWREVYLWVGEQHWFDLHTVDIVGNERISKSEILEYSRLQTGGSIFDIDVNKAVLQVESHPWVRRARGTRRLPDTILIEVEEHVPVGLVKLDRIYYVNDEGTPFKVAPKEVERDYIVIEGLQNSHFEVLAAGQSKVRRALDLIDIYKQHPIGDLAPLKRIVHKYNGLEIYVGREPTQLVLGKGNLNDTLDRAAKLLRHLNEEDKVALSIHLDNRKQPERVSVKLKETNREHDNEMTN